MNKLTSSLFVVLVLLLSSSLSLFSQEKKVILDNEQENSRLALERLQKQGRQEKQNRILVSLLSRLSENDGLIDTLELVEGQKDEIRAIQEQYRVEEEALELPDEPTRLDEEKYNRQHHNLKTKFAIKIRECLIEGQVEAIFSSRISDKGIPRVLVQSQIGDVLRLTDEQKKRIADSSDEISKKIGAFQLEIRKEACKAVFEELTPEQRKQFLRIYDLESLASYFHQLPIRQLGNNYHFKPYKETPTLFELESVFPEFKKSKK